MTEVQSAFRDDSARSIETEELDAFGHREFATALVRAVRSVPSPFTLGLFGAWGTGKSTVLAEVGRRLRKDFNGEIAYTSFDAWRYEGDSLRREFIRDVATDLEKTGQLAEGFDLQEHLKSFYSDFGKTEVAKIEFSREAVGPALIASGGVLALLVGVAVVVPTLGYSNATALNVILALLGPALAFVLLTLNRVVVPPPVQETLRRYEAPEQFAASFSDLVGKVAARDLVIGIDNLDRCSPDRVDQVLATIKTFLEPAIARSDGPIPERLCFIIAADDEALRRHLLAQELSVPADGAEPSKDAGKGYEQAKIAVDEYLRKFFNAYIHLTDVLDEDIRSFTADELRPFEEAHPEISDETARSLIEITAYGLKRNPRRIKQFVNNLELRTQVMHEKREAGGIQIEPDVLMIAKLAVIEEEFPEKFRKLVERPTLLDQWQREVAGGHSEDMDERRFQGFLRFTDHIETQHVRAYLTLRQTEAERSLPRYVEFTGLLDDGDVVGVTQLLSEEEDGAAAYVGSVKAYFEEQLISAAWSTSHNVLRSIVGVDRLRASCELVAFSVDEALSHPPLRVRLSQLDPADLLDAAHKCLTGDKFEAVAIQLVEAVGDLEEARQRADLFEAVGNLSHALSDRVVAEVRAQIDRPEMSSDFAAYQSLAEKVPAVVGDAAVEAGISSLEEGSKEHAVKDPAFRILLAVARSSSATSVVVSRFLALVNDWISRLREGSGGELAELASLLSASIGAWQDAGALEDLAVNLRDGWPQTPDEARADVVQFGVRLCECSDRVDGVVGGDFGERLVEVKGVESVAEWVAEAGNGIPRGLVEGLVAGAEDSLRSDNEARREATVQILTRVLEPGEAEDRIAGAIQASLDSGPAGAAGQLLSYLPQARAEQMFDAVLGEVEGTVPTESRARLIADFQDQLSESQRVRAVKVLIDAVTADRENVDALAPVIERFRLEDASHRLEAVERLIDFERDGVTGLPRTEALLRAADSIAGSRSSRARSEVEKRLRALRDSNEKPKARDFAASFLSSRGESR